MRYHEELKSHPAILSMLNDSDTYDLIRMNPKEIVVEQESTIQHVFILVEGVLKVEHLMEDGYVLHIDFVGPYDFMGDLELLVNQSAVHQVQVTEQALLVRLSVSEYWRLMKTSSDFSMANSQSLAHKLRGTTENFANYVRLPLKIRLYKELINMHSLAVDSPTYLDYSSDSLSEKLGVTKRSVNRLLKDMRESGLIQTSATHSLSVSEDNLEKLMAYVEEYD
ncbi:MAG: Crp/Fnr family transcriptional regulator [Vagococcus sp.]